jgi:hypothetical protein
MFSLHWRKGASPCLERAPGLDVATAAAIAMIGIATLCAASCRADDARSGIAKGSVDTEHLFGFTEGTDIGAAGEKDVELDSTGRSGRQGGSFANAASEFEFKYTAFQNFRISAAAALAYYDIAGVTGLEDRRQAAMQSLSLDARFRLLDRERSPFGLTLSIAPHWGFADETTGVRIGHFGVEALLRADREIVPEQLYAGANLLFDTDRTRLRAAGDVEQEPMLGIGAAVSLQVSPGWWAGAEARYLRSYEGAGLNAFSGQALYLGPTLYARIGEKAWLSAAWNFQAWGGAVGLPGALDLTNFERHQFKFRVGYEF